MRRFISLLGRAAMFKLLRAASLGNDMNGGFFRLNNFLNRP
jgi:hypothetical protein